MDMKGELPHQMQGPPTWRHVLAGLSDADKQRMQQELGITAKTWGRWIHGKTELPHLRHLQALVQALPPRERDLFVRLVQLDPNFSLRDHSLIGTEETLLRTIPGDQYARVLDAVALHRGLVRFMTVCDLVLQQAGEQLDPERTGITLMLLLCSPPSSPGAKVRSLSERLRRRSTPNAPGALSQQRAFFGAESLAGYVVATNCPVVVPDVAQHQGLLPLQEDDLANAASVAAYPIVRGQHVAGCLLVASTQADFFTQARRDLLHDYANLLMLAFADREFYAPEQIALSPMPQLSVQASVLADLQQRVLASVRQGKPHRDPVEAEQQVWQDIEAELLRWTQQQATDE